jgi:DNA adenine methylase
MSEITKIEANSFLRWAGSKKILVNEITKHFPNKYTNYIEPFLGSVAIFFSIKEKRNSYISDSNQRLINTYIQVRDNIDEVIHFLKQYRNEKEFYYYLRSFESTTLAEEAAIFIYLNKTCFNGLYRVNKANIFNVPYGNRINVDFVTESLLKTVSKSLSNVNIMCLDFEETLANINENDLVFIDPPYVTTHNNNGFIEYNQKIFTWHDQIRLHNYINQIIAKNAFFIMTNAAHNSLLDLYSNVCTPIVLKRYSCIGGRNSYRGFVEEFLFTNVNK